jgi:hypothetical protein
MNNETMNSFAHTDGPGTPRDDEKPATTALYLAFALLWCFGWTFLWQLLP